LPRCADMLLTLSHFLPPCIISILKVRTSLSFYLVAVDSRRYSVDPPSGPLPPRLHMIGSPFPSSFPSTASHVCPLLFAECFRILSFRSVPDPPCSKNLSVRFFLIFFLFLSFSPFFVCLCFCIGFFSYKTKHLIVLLGWRPPFAIFTFFLSLLPNTFFTFVGSRPPPSLMLFSSLGGTGYRPGSLVPDCPLSSFITS